MEKMNNQLATARKVKYNSLPTEIDMLQFDYAHASFQV